MEDIVITLKDCFDNDIEGIGAENSFTFRMWDKDFEEEYVDFEIKFKISIPWITNKLLYFIYLPAHKYAGKICWYVIENYKQLREQMSIGYIKRPGLIIKGTYKLGIDEPEMPDTLYVYVENKIVAGEKFYENNKFDELAKKLGITLYLRDEAYRKERENNLINMAFICHDSLDKELIARPIAQGLQSKLFRVWYDEYSLKVGDSLREAIEKGIKEVKKCIIIITPNFLKNFGWAKKEFDSIFIREMVKNERIILPIWYNVTQQEVYEYSPSLANTVALHWPIRDMLQETEYKKAIETIIGDISNQISFQKRKIPDFSDLQIQIKAKDKHSAGSTNFSLGN